MLVVEECRAQHRLIVGMCLPQQGVEIRQQTVAQTDRVADKRRHLRVHPRLIHRVIVIPGVNGKTRMHHAVLHPTNKQFGIGLIAREAADVVADVVQTGQTHANAHARVVTQRLPAGAVVAAPRLHVTLHSRTAGT